MKTVRFGIKTGVAGLALTIPILYYTDFKVVFNGYLTAGGIYASSILFLTLAIFFTLFTLILYLSTYKWLLWLFIFIPTVHFLATSISSFKHYLKPGALSLYRGICIFATLLNELMGPVLICLKFEIAVVTCTGFTLCLINGISLFSGILLTMSVLMLASLNVVMYLAGQIFELSQARIQEWKRSSETSMPLQTQASLRPCRINVGSQYYVDRGVLPKLNFAVLENVITTALALR